jgi:small conductance mechanosensitive channel
MKPFSLQQDSITSLPADTDFKFLDHFTWDSISTYCWDLLVSFGPKLILAIIVLIVGLWLIKVTKRVLVKALGRRKIDVTARKFVVDLVGALLSITLLISVLSLFGVPTTSFIAILGAAGLAIGLALQGALQNFAGGVLIFFFNPYRVGHLIETEEVVGFVKDIQIFHTVLVDLDNKRVVVPNGPIMNKKIVNFTAEGSVRVELSVGVAYDTDLRKAEQIIKDALKKDKRVLASPEPVVGVSNLGDSSIEFFVRPYTKPNLYWEVHMASLLNVREALSEAGIKIPFPQREITISNDSTGSV